MSVINDLATLLACPRCDRALTSSGAGFACAGCRVEFPRVARMPWLFAEPAAALDEWRGRLHFSLQHLERERTRLASALGDRALRGPTRARLESLARALADHGSELEQLLAPLALETHMAAHETYLALRTRLPVDQGLTTYYANVHRDWCWGDEENEASASILEAALGSAMPRRMLVLGSGAGRLAYDLHARTNADLTVSFDFNPLLMIIADTMARGGTLNLHEFPLAPRSVADQAVRRRLAAPAAARPGLVHMLGDAHRPPFVHGAFDSVVTPWLIDILPERFDVLCRRINALLADGGRWLEFGSLSFHDPDPRARYGLDECVAVLAENGFGEIEVAEHDLPYLCSPASRHARRERIVVWSAVKQHGAKPPPRHEACPDWLVRGNEPVPLSDSFRAQAGATRIHAFLMSMIDGRRSLKDMAKLCVEQRLMSEAEAEPAIRTFLMKMYDDSRRGTLY